MNNANILTINLLIVIITYYQSQLMVIPYVSITLLSDLYILSLLIFIFLKKQLQYILLLSLFFREKTSLNNLPQIIQLISGGDRTSIHIWLVSNTLGDIAAPDMLLIDAQVQGPVGSVSTGACMKNKVLWERMYVIK